MKITIVAIVVRGMRCSIGSIDNYNNLKMNLDQAGLSELANNHMTETQSSSVLLLSFMNVF